MGYTNTLSFICLYYSTASFSKTLICFSEVCNYVKAERLSEPGKHSYVHASICIHYSGILRHKVQHAKGSGCSCMHLTKNPAPTLSWTRSYCKQMACPRAFATAHICVCARNCNLSHKQAPPQSKTNPHQVKVKLRNKGVHHSKSFLFPVCGRTFLRSPDTNQNPINFSENKRPVRTAGLLCRIWQL